MNNHYFTYWIGIHGRKRFVKLTNKVFRYANIPEELKKTRNKDQYLFDYFLSVYFVVVLNYFSVSLEGMNFMLDMLFAPGMSTLYPPKDILRDQKMNIPRIENFIKKDLKRFYSL